MLDHKVIGLDLVVCSMKACPAPPAWAGICGNVSMKGARWVLRKRHLNRL